jgi:hypothetical protein
MDEFSVRINNGMNTDFAAEFTRLFQGGCGIINKDWTQAEKFDGTNSASCYSNEAALVASLTSEAYNNYGFEVDYYIKNISTKRDELYGEDPLWNIERRFKLNVYTEQVPNLQRQYQIQGMVYTEMITLQCTIAHFAEASGYDYERTKYTEELSTVPKIGDIMYFKYCDKYYEVINVKAFGDNSSFLGTPITYTFTLRMWRNNHEDVDVASVNPDNMPIADYTSLAETFGIDGAEEEKGVSKVEVMDKEGNGDYLAINPDVADSSKNTSYIPDENSKWDDDWDNFKF